MRHKDMTPLWFWEHHYTKRGWKSRLIAPAVMTHRTVSSVALAKKLNVHPAYVRFLRKQLSMPLITKRQRIEQLLVENAKQKNRAIADQVGSDIATVRNIRIRLGLASTRKTKPIELAKLAIKNNPDLRNEKLALLCNVSTGTIFRARKILGIKSHSMYDRCLTCSNALPKNRNPALGFCSEECRWERKLQRAKVTERKPGRRLKRSENHRRWWTKNKEILRERSREKSAKRRQLNPRFCFVCGEKIGKRAIRYCGPHCREIVQSEKNVERKRNSFVPRQVFCIHCGDYVRTTTFDNYRGHRTCDKCRADVRREWSRGRKEMEKVFARAAYELGLTSASKDRDRITFSAMRELGFTQASQKRRMAI